MKVVPLAVLLKAYLRSRPLSVRTERNYAAVVAQFERWLGRRGTLPDLAVRGDEYIEFRILGGKINGEAISASKMTAAGHRGVLATLMLFAVRQKWCRKVTLRPIRKPRIIPNALLLAEISKLLKHATPRQRAAILLCFDTGFRRSDLFAAKWSETFRNGDETLISRVVQKTGRVETRRLRRETVAALEVIRKPGSEYLLPGPRSVSNWTARWQHLGARAGVDTKRRGLQAVRRSGASYLAANGQSAMKYLGHSTPGLAERHYIDPRIASDIPDLPPPLDSDPDAA